MRCFKPASGGIAVSQGVSPGHTGVDGGGKPEKETPSADGVSFLYRVFGKEWLYPNSADGMMQVQTIVCSGKGSADMKRWTIVLCLLAVLALSGCQKKEEITEYRLPEGAQWIIGQGSYADILKDRDERVSAVSELDPAYGVSAVLEDGCLILSATEDQRQNVIAHNTELAREAAQAFGELSHLHSVEWSEDFSTVTCRLYYPDCIGADMKETAENMVPLSIISYILHLNRILTTGDCDAPIKLTLKNGKSGYICAAGLMPYEGAETSDKDWERSMTEDVLQSERLEGYQDLRMELSEIDGEKLIFTPLERNGFYQNDEKLCLCMDSVYGEEVTLPYYIEVGDVFVLRVDGGYALHEDGDNIPDLAPRAMIPEKYYSER